MRESLSFSLGIRRRVILLFFFLLFSVLFPCILVARVWFFSTLEKVETEFLKQGYVSSTFYFNTRKFLLEDLARNYARHQDIASDFSQKNQVTQESFLQALKKEAGISFVFVVDESGKIVAGASDQDEFLKSEGFFGTFLFNGARPGTSSSGFVRTPDDRLWLIAFAPITASDAPLRKMGLIVLGVSVRDAVFERLSADLNMKIKFFHALNLFAFSAADEAEEPDSAKTSLKEMVYSQKPYLIAKSQDTAGGYYCDILMRDLNGDPIGLMRLKDPLFASLEVSKYISIFLWSVFFILLIGAWFSVAYLSRHITAPLVKLRNAIRDITSSRDLSKRLDTELEDEVGGLILEFNSMLEELEKMNAKIKRSGEEVSVLYRDLLGQKRFTAEILTLAHSIILVLMPDGRVKFVNEAIERVAGYRSEEVIGKDWFDMFLPLGLRQDERKKFEDMTQGRMDLYRQVENSIWTKDGKERSILWNNSLLVDKKGETVSVISVGQDISEHKRVETELRKKMADLERFYRVTMDREKVVLQLKKEVVGLRARLDGK